MPEGPEVWILSKVINTYYNKPTKTCSIGKHLIMCETKENWSFGLSGTVNINEDDILSKPPTGWLYGNIESYTNYDDVVVALGVDWMQASREELEAEVQTWAKSKAKLAALLLDQTRICGIGVAWGSEVLHKAGLRPDVKACDQQLFTLVDAMIEIRTYVQTLYLQKLVDSKNVKEFINGWFLNLYEIREMQVYKKGKKVEVSSRTWWVKAE